MKLVIISHTPHYTADGEILGWGPTLREIDALAGIFDRVTHLAPLHPEPPPASAMPYRAANVDFRALVPSGGKSVSAKLGILVKLPHNLRRILREVRSADLVHVRCPANIGLIALVALRLVFPKKRVWVKYAGNWKPLGHDTWSNRLQRRWLARGVNGFVSINGEWPDQKAHIESFLNPCLTGKELEIGRIAATSKTLDAPVRLLFAGALVPAKGVGIAIEAARMLKDRGFAVALELVGDGPGRVGFERLVRELGLDDAVHFHGWQARANMPDFFARAHFLILPSRSEGWPKVLSEAMAFGAVPIASAVSSIPLILERTRAGVAVMPLEPAVFAEAVARIAAEPELWQRYRTACLAAAPGFSFNAYLDTLRRAFDRHLDLKFEDSYGGESP